MFEHFATVQKKENKGNLFHIFGWKLLKFNFKDFYITSSLEIWSISCINLKTKRLSSLVYPDSIYHS